MEKPVTGRVAFYENPASIQLVIPTHKFWPGIIFLFIWLALCVFMFVIGLGVIVIGFLNSFLAGLGGIFFTVLVTGIGAVGLSGLMRMLKGKQIVTFNKYVVTVEETGAGIFNSKKIFALERIKNVRVERVPNRRLFARKFEFEDAKQLMPDYHCLCFDYLGKPVYFGLYIPKAEAIALLEHLRAKIVFIEDNS